MKETPSPPSPELRRHLVSSDGRGGRAGDRGTGTWYHRDVKLSQRDPTVQGNEPHTSHLKAKPPVELLKMQIARPWHHRFRLQGQWKSQKMPTGSLED